ncbi:hypothetical protein [Nesterenkonia massiliensis]|uniref:hypothetical protein n=1 Tax=Nesterenkonia massiliensis TaxID=1232429 RepID=UPI0005C81A9D|nr:hypothetical protein [Nesterenkonia massiliensis]
MSNTSGGCNDSAAQVRFQQLRSRRATVHGPRADPTLAEALGDPRHGILRQQERIRSAQRLRRRQLVIALCAAAVLGGIFALVWVLAASASDATGPLLPAAVGFGAMFLMGLGVLRTMSRVEKTFSSGRTDAAQGSS